MAGRFVDAKPRDPLQCANGCASVRSDSVLLGPDFEVGPGPKFHLYLVPKPQIRSSSDVSGAMFGDLGRLRACKGGQCYRVRPA